MPRFVDDLDKFYKEHYMQAASRFPATIKKSAAKKVKEIYRNTYFWGAQGIIELDMQGLERLTHARLDMILSGLQVEIYDIQREVDMLKKRKLTNGMIAELLPRGGSAIQLFLAHCDVLAAEGRGAGIPGI